MISRLLLIAALVQAAACAGTMHMIGDGPDGWPNDRRGAATSVAECQTLLGRAGGRASTGLNPHRIDLVNWNIRKGSLDPWETDLAALTADAELLTLQEAVMNGIDQRHRGELRHTAFSQGFSTPRRTTGVATYSSVAPLSECRLSVVEPILRTRKATSVTEFPLIGTERTLLVVNVHAVNFSLGLGRYREQMEQIRQVLDAHQGPAILTGDFNTWRRKRLELVETLIADLHFGAVNLQKDHRTTFNGLALDHVFVRGLSVRESVSPEVVSSDHNPILVELRL